MMVMKSKAGLVLAVLFALAASSHWLMGRASSIDPTNPGTTLADVERWVATLVPVPEITTPALAPQIARDDIVLFDVRERAEFDQSHLMGAIHVDPDMDAAGFMAAHGPRLNARAVVFYCSVGLRSGRLLARIADSIPRSVPVAAFNLRGGIFRWFIEGRPVLSAAGPARDVHPFDAAWGALLARSRQTAQ